VGRARRTIAIAAAALCGGSVIVSCTDSSTPRTTPAPPAAARPAQQPARPAPATRHRSAARRTTDVPLARRDAVAHPARLPLHLRTGSARQVITVAAPSTTSTRGTLQAWRKVSGGWRRVGAATPAWLGSDGLSAHPSESNSATPIGNFTLTRAFGHDPDPGTALPYTRTTPAYWWISQSGPLYNTMQHCTSQCAFRQGDPNEHLYFETPYYDYAVVLDYNTRNAPGGVRQGAGSAFFLHVSVGAPTAGCISIAPDRLVRVLRWLTPQAHPRILVGIT
jgi:L,D-peptidoglycan transpeptidase YkuD (ErfK/YbiS/YcfS/YnhG family)